MRVLVSAYACNPTEGSEPGAGWAFTLAAAHVADEVVLLTRANNIPALRSALDSEPVGDRVTAVAIDYSKSVLALKRKLGLVRSYYLAWQYRAGRIARKLHSEKPFDVAHHVTFAVDWLPSPTIQIGAARVWGPIGGATSIPRGFWHWLPVSARIRESVRHVATGILRKLVGARIAKSVDVVLAQNLDDLQYFRSLNPNTVLAPNVVVEPVSEVKPRREFENQIAFVGRLVPLKALGITLHVIARDELHSWGLVVVGDGPERARCERLTARLGLAHRVKFVGALPHDKSLEVIAGSDALLSTSLHEAAGFAVAEALTLGCPVVALRHGGPEVLVAPNEGVLVEPNDDVVLKLAEAVTASQQLPRSPSADWTPERLPHLLQTTYALATAAAALRHK
jgi:glycosyltransferase involved in cell wall biosynthesis